MPPSQTSLQPGFGRLLAAGCLLFGLQLLGPLLTIPLHIPLGYNEGWNALFDARAVTAGAGPLYPGPDSLVFNNYPPLGFYLVGALGQAFGGDMIVAGRVAALLGLLASAALGADCLRSLGAPGRAAFAAALLLLLYVAAFYRAYFVMDDPQWLAHAVMLGGLAVLLRGWRQAGRGAAPIGAGSVILAALLAVAGGFIKHNLVALPLAVTVWLWRHDRRAAAIWLGAALAGLAAGLAATYALHGAIAFADVLHHRRVMRIGLMLYAASRLAPMLPMGLAAALLLRHAWRGAAPPMRAAIEFVALFAGIAAVTGTLQRTGEGVYYNAHFETLVATCLAFGLGLAAAFRAPVPWRGFTIDPTRAGLLAALPLILGLPWHLPIAWSDIADRAAREAAWRPVIARIAAANGPAGCMRMSLCWWAGKPSRLDMFNLTESVTRGGTLDGMRAAIARGQLAIVEDDPASGIHRTVRHRLGRDPIMDALAASGYAPVLRGSVGAQVTVLLTWPDAGQVSAARAETRRSKF